VPCARDHFLFQALYSNSLPIRQHASLQLIRAADNAERISILTAVLWDMVQDEMDDFLMVASDRGSLIMTPSEEEASFHSSASSSSSSSSLSRCEFLEAERIVQMYGLLVHYVTEYDERFYNFLIQGGLDWVCQRVLALVSLLIVPSRRVGLEAGGLSPTSPRDDPDLLSDSNCPPFSPSLSSLNEKSRQMHLNVSQTRNMIFSSSFQEEIKKRLYVLVDFCSRLTILAQEKDKARNEAAYEWFWKRHSRNLNQRMVSHFEKEDGQEDDDDDDDDESSKTGGFLRPSYSTALTDGTLLGGIELISPLGCIIGAALILKRSKAVSSCPGRAGVSTVLMAEDYVANPGNELDSVTWILGKMMDTQGEVMVLPKESESEESKKVNAENVGGDVKKRKRTLLRMGDKSTLGGDDSVVNNGQSPKRRRWLQHNTRTQSSLAGNPSESTSTSRVFSSAAEALASSVLSSFERNEAQGSDGSRLFPSSLERLMELSMASGNRNGCLDENDDNDKSDDDDDDDDQCSNPFDEDEEEDIESDVDMEDSEEHEGMMDDEDIESEIEDEDGKEDDEEDDEDDIDHDDDDDGNDEDDEYDEDRDDEHILDDIILNARSNQFPCNHMMAVDAELENIRSSLSATNQRLKEVLRQKENSSGPGPSTCNKEKSKARRSKAWLRASIELLYVQHPQHNHYYHGHTKLNMLTNEREIVLHRRSHRLNGKFCTVLTPSAEQELLHNICNIVRPPKEPPKLKVFLRRAPTQEEFFRGSLSQNPILLSSLKGDVNTTSSDYDPTVKDLRQHIANDLQMADSAELLELLVANKILDMNLKLRVVAQTIWRSHVLENNSVTQAESTFRQIMAASIFGESAILSRSRFDEDSPMSDLPPMVVTYRLAGVDGEATEDKIEDNELEDPDAPSATSTTNAEQEAKMEKEYGVTRLISKGRGINVLLRSLEMYLGFVLKRIRRDDVDSQAVIFGKQIVRKNKSRLRFLKDAPCSALTLLQYCAMIGDNRKKMINAQAPTVLLRLLLDVLNSIDQTPKSIELGKNTSNMSQTYQKSSIISSNPTTEALQALIENLSSDISNEMMKKTLVKSSSQDFEDSDASLDNEEGEATTLPILLSSLQTTSLSPPLRKVVAKLLPFLTYGQRSQSRALASQFLKHIKIENIETKSVVSNENKAENCSLLMETFIDAAIHLPPVAVCDTLRAELISQGFVSSIKNFVLKSVPLRPPPWSTALYSKKEKILENERNMLSREWEAYYSRNGLIIGFKILIGLCNDHEQTQSYLGNDENTEDKIPLIVTAHWIESTSDKDGINTNGLGILAETLLDNMMNNNDVVGRKISELRGKTRDRKKELAQEQRQKALAKMSGLGNFTYSPSETLQLGKAKLPVLEHPTKVTGSKSSANNAPFGDKPAWMLEMEAMEDESGLVCSVCQEGRNYKPSEILGLYAFMKRVTIPQNRGGGCGNIDGTSLLLSLPPRIPETLRGSEADDEWYQPSMTLASSLKSTSHGASTVSATSIMGPRSYNFVTTVTAGNAIHCSCHARARSADRNHPKAPKSEWEGASLRNSRVSCNVILPLMSKQNHKIPVVEMESALADHQLAVSNILGSKPKSMLWTILHDVRLLILRIAYGEALNMDCGGGSLSSNVSLIFHNLFLAHMFAKNAEHDSSANVLHAKGLSTAYLAASSILRCTDLVQTAKTKQLRRAFADCAPMSAICCILFQNTINDEDVSSANSMILTTENVPNIPPPKRRWEMHKYHFLSGLLQCAGRRHAQGIDGSGCLTTGRRVRSSSLSEWNEDNSTLSPRRHIGKRNGLSVEEYGRIMRPMLILYACLDQLSSVFTPQMDDEIVENCSQQLVKSIESCQKAGDIRSLIHQANISLDDTAIIEEIEAGMNTV
jgi:hypothetical protein